jgi:magnesium chelatase subunit D
VREAWLEAWRALVATAMALGVAGVRACQFALAAARAGAALAGRYEVDERDLDLAARLVLSPRATQIPAPPEEPEAPDEAPPEEPESDADNPGEDDDPPEPPDLD